MDPLSQLFNLFRFEAEVYHNARMGGRWQVSESESNEMCFHMITEGCALLNIDENDSIILNEGDLLVIPCGLEHKITPITATDCEPFCLDYKNSDTNESIGILCGKIWFDEFRKHQLLKQLPTYFIIKNSAENVWIQHILSSILHESYENNSSVVLNRLCEVLFIKAVRTHLITNNTQIGFLKLYSNQDIAEVIHKIHDSPKTPWSIESLATAASMSRTKLIKKFRLISGWTVMQYVTWWRMQLAWQQLSAEKSVAETSENVGYRSEAAFARAFKREFGVSVGKVRKGKHLASLPDK